MDRMIWSSILHHRTKTEITQQPSVLAPIRIPMAHLSYTLMSKPLTEKIFSSEMLLWHVLLPSTLTAGYRPAETGITI